MAGESEWTTPLPRGRTHLLLEYIWADRHMAVGRVLAVGVIAAIEAMNGDMIAMKKETTTTTGEDPRLLTTAEDHTGQDHALAPTLLVITEVQLLS